MARDFIFAIARIRSKENELLTQQNLDQLMNCHNTDECIKFLKDKGYGNGTEYDSDEIIKNELNKLWSFMKELTSDISDFKIMLYTYDFHNLKVAVKSVISDISPDKFFIDRGIIDAKEIYNCVDKRQFYKLPDYMNDVAEEAFDILLKTNDSQLCDVILDSKNLEQILKTGEESKEPLIKYYGEFFVACANIKTAVRCCMMGKSSNFMKRAIVECKTLDKNKLIQNACKSIDDIYSYLLITDYKDAAAELKKSFSNFEKWCDNTLMIKIKQEKYNPFTFGAVIAYAMAKETEIKAVRIILSGKQNELDESVIRERLRDMYV